MGLRRRQLGHARACPRRLGPARCRIRAEPSGEDEVQALSTKVGFDLSYENADRSWDLPVPATFVLDRVGSVRARHVDPNYRERMQPTEILGALRGIRDGIVGARVDTASWTRTVRDR